MSNNEQETAISDFVPIDIIINMKIGSMFLTHLEYRIKAFVETEDQREALIRASKLISEFITAVEPGQQQEPPHQLEGCVVERRVSEYFKNKPSDIIEWIK